MNDTLIAMKYLEKKGIRKPFQLKKRINLRIDELIEILEDYEKFRQDFKGVVHDHRSSPPDRN